MRTRLLATGAAATLLALTGCSGGSSEDSGQPAGAPSEARAEGAPAALDTDGAARAATVRLESRDIKKTGQVTMVAKDLDTIREQLDNLLAEYAGVVSDEETRNDDDGRPLTSLLTISVPSEHFYAVMLALKADKATKSSDISTENLHEQIVDVEARLARLQASHKRLREFLSEATDVNTLLNYEQRLTQVETEIGTLTAQRESLATVTSYSTITISMRTPEAPAPKKKDPLEHAGFLTGLSNGWSALMDVLLVVATVLGAVLPFGVLAALGALPVWLLMRRRSANRGLVHEVGEAG